MTQSCNLDDSPPPHALVALGANLPWDGRAPSETLQLALAALGENGLEVVAFSGLFATPCFPAGSGPDYVNAACAIDARTHDAASILSVLHRIEERFGRKRAQRWGMRTLDLDLLAVGDSVLPDKVTQGYWAGLPLADQAQLAPGELVLPHPRMQDRAFVLVPLSRVAPGWRHPVSGRTVAEMCASLPPADCAAVVALTDQGLPSVASAPMSRLSEG